MTNLFADDWDDEPPRPPGFECRRMRIGRRLGGELIGASVWEVPPGKRQGPYHLHHGNEEWLIVLEGNPTLRTPEGERELEPGDAVAFRRGPEGAHQVLNRSDRPARYLILSTMIEPEVVEYPDSGKVGAIAGAAPGAAHEPVFEAFLPVDAAVDYWEGEPES